MISLLKIVIYMILISYSLMFYMVYFSILIDVGIINYLYVIISHIETLMIIPLVCLLYRALHPKV